MRTYCGIFAMITIVCSCSFACYGRGRAEADPRWQQAVTLKESGDYVGAANMYRSIFWDYPNSQRAALRIALNEQRAGITADAAASFVTANSVDPYGYWSEVGLYYEAKFHVDNGQLADAELCLEILEKRFPDSRWCARGRAAIATARNVVDSGQDASAGAMAEAANIEAILARENLAWESLSRANKSHGQGQDNQRLAALERIVSLFPDTCAALDARQSRGYLLIRNQRLTEAATELQSLASDLEFTSPHSRIRYDVEYRLAAVDHALGNKQQALTRYAQLTELAEDPQIVSKAGAQAAGLQLETMQAKLTGEKVISPEDWEAVRTYAEEVRLSGGREQDVVRAELLNMESYCWQGMPIEAVTAAEEFLSTHDENEYKLDTATVCFFAGEEYLKLGEYQDALRHFRKVVSLYENEREMWKGMDHLPRTYYRIWETLRKQGADESKIQEAAQLLLTRFPDSEYAKPVLIWTKGNKEQSIDN